MDIVVVPAFAVFVVQAGHTFGLALTPFRHAYTFPGRLTFVTKAPQVFKQVLHLNCCNGAESTSVLRVTAYCLVTSRDCDTVN